MSLARSELLQRLCFPKIWEEKGLYPEDLYRVQLEAFSVWTNGSRISQTYSTTDYWTEWENCNLASLKSWADDKYRILTSSPQSDYHPLYLAERIDAQTLFAACKQIISRRAR